MCAALDTYLRSVSVGVHRVHAQIDRLHFTSWERANRDPLRPKYTGHDCMPSLFWRNYPLNIKDVN